MTTNVSNVDFLKWYPFHEDTDTVVLTTDADWGIISSPRGVVFFHASKRVQVKQCCMLGARNF